MLYFSRWKILMIALVCLSGIYYAVPAFLGDKTPSFFSEKRINLGLDLRGGSYLLLEVGVDVYLKEQLDNLRQDIRQELRSNLVEGKNIGYRGGLAILDNAVRINLTDSSQQDAVETLLRRMSRDLDVTSDGSTLFVNYTEAALTTMKRNVVSQSIEIVRRRVDETGTREPDIQRQGDNRILLQVPGLDNPEMLKSLLGKTAKLTFHMVDMSMPYPDFSNSPVPPGSVRVMSDAEDGSAYVLKKRALISGDLLVDAKAGLRDGAYVVNIRFNNLGAKKFASITKNNVGKPFAIVLDNKVLTAPYIRSVILDGAAEISGNFTSESSSKLAILLRSGALPAPLEIVEERSVGPSLGADSIAAGKNAVGIGIVLVIILMLLVYRFFGIIANIALLVNMALILGALSLLGATLTLPGIAGIVLTMGMAVDANVLIYERIKEEQRNGRSSFGAVENGFRQAFTTIFDANLTTFIAALVLFIYGSGPIKGFAVTLSIGILSSVFTATLFTRFLVASWVRYRKPSELKI